MQQAGRGGRAGEISDSIVILPSSGSGTFLTPRSDFLSQYSVEVHDEDALTEYLESESCRRGVLAQHLDGHVEGKSCVETDSILCDRCHASVTAMPVLDEGSGSGSPMLGASDATHQPLRAEMFRDVQLAQFHHVPPALCLRQLMLGTSVERSHCQGVAMPDCGYATVPSKGHVRQDLASCCSALAPFGQWAEFDPQTDIWKCGLDSRPVVREVQALHLNILLRLSIH